MKKRKKKNENQTQSSNVKCEENHFYIQIKAFHQFVKRINIKIKQILFESASHRRKEVRHIT